MSLQLLELIGILEEGAHAADQCVLGRVVSGGEGIDERRPLTNNRAHLANGLRAAPAKMCASAFVLMR